MKSMEWPRLLSRRRLKDKAATSSTSRSVFQQDFDRIIFSTPFRRLQDKTQVFPLASNDFVRTRLTHSLETSSVGRSLGTMVGELVCRRHSNLSERFHPSDFGAIVAAACIAHDIGNPPFGHSGEDVIRHWFKKSPIARKVAKKLQPSQRRDIEKYEGNAQGFRILAHLQWGKPGGLKLTCATLGAFTKYPVGSLSAGKAAKGGKVPVGQKKFGFFQEDRELFAEVAEETGLIPHGTGWKRHPLVYLVEAADDICYQLIDLEDGFRLGLITYDEISGYYHGILKGQNLPSPPPSAPFPITESQKEHIGMLRSRAIGTLIQQVAEAFIKEEKTILKGELEDPLTKRIDARDTLKAISDVSIERIYRSRNVIEIEAAGFEVLSGLLDTFVGAALASSKSDTRAEKMLEVLPSGFHVQGTPYSRLLRILDFVSGMTDSYAVSLFKKIKGISLPGQ